MDELHEKQERLKTYLAEKGSLAIAFSGGVDSTFLLKVGHIVLGEQCIAITAVSEVNPHWETEEAEAFCQREGIRHFLVQTNELQDEAFACNDKNRCYYCKKRIFGEVKQIAKEQGISYVAEGSNLDDLSDYRPGLKAIAELNVLSPLRECDLSKQDIRDLSKELGLTTWEKPSFACLASRIPYGERITAENMKKVECAEAYLRSLGLKTYRVRLHGNTLARIEVDPADFPFLTQSKTAEALTAAFRELGILYVTLDLNGFQSGSMNRVLKP